MSHKLKEVIIELDRAKNLIKQQQKEINRLKNLALDRIVRETLTRKAQEK